MDFMKAFFCFILVIILVHIKSSIILLRCGLSTKIFFTKINHQTIFDLCTLITIMNTAVYDMFEFI